MKISQDVAEGMLARSREAGLLTQPWGWTEGPGCRPCWARAALGSTHSPHAGEAHGRETETDHVPTSHQAGVMGRGRPGTLGTPYKSFVQTETYTNEVHFAAYQKAFFFANSYPLWMRHCGLHSDRDGQHFKGPRDEA